MTRMVLTTKRKRILLVAAVVLLGAGGTLAWRWWSRAPEDVLLASGTIEATEVDVSFKIPGRVIARPVDEGDRLEPGALVGRLESLELEAELDRLRAALRATETRVPQLRTEIARLEELTGGRIAEARALRRDLHGEAHEPYPGRRPQARGRTVRGDSHAAF